MESKSAGPRALPRDAAAVAALLKEAGVQQYEPRVLCQLLEFAYRYVAAVLDEARALSQHAKKRQVEAEDVRLAAAQQLERGFTAPPPRELLLELTRGRNLQPLPLLKPHCGLRLPPDRYCLAACNYRLARPARRPRPVPPAPVKKPTTLLTVPKTQTVSVPKPTFKFSSGGKAIAKPVVKMETDDMGAVKRKRDDDDYDAL